MKKVENENFYRVFNYKDVKVYIGYGVKAGSAIEISLKSSLPLIGHTFGLKGVTV